MPIADVYCDDCIEFARKRAEKSVKLTIGSPPYPHKAERYIGGIAKKLHCVEWVEWMVDVTEAALRITDGYVIWVVNDSVVDGELKPACYGLVWHMWQRTKELGVVERPVIWHKNAPPNGGKHWFSNDWEFILAFKGRRDPYFNYQAIGTPPRYKSGGKFRQRTATGERRVGSEYPTNAVARPRNVLQADFDEDSCPIGDLHYVTVGGGRLGSKLAHDNEAPYPEKLIEPFIQACTEPGDTVCDFFSGSGTTLAVSIMNGRNFVGCDSRESQVALTTARYKEALERMESRDVSSQPQG